MTNLGFGTADVGGAFVNELAKELGKAPATLVAYLKKHLPATLTKRKNSNNRLANFATADGVSGLRAHYTPTVAPAAFESELQMLREENARLKQENENLWRTVCLLEDRLDVVEHEYAELIEAKDNERAEWDAKADHRANMLAKADNAIAISTENNATVRSWIDELTSEQQQQWRQANEYRQIHPTARSKSRQPGGKKSSAELTVVRVPQDLQRSEETTDNV